MYQADGNNVGELDAIERSELSVERYRLGLRRDERDSDMESARDEESRSDDQLYRM